MAVIQFVLGMDLTKVELGDLDCSQPFEDMARLEWIKFGKAKLDHVPIGIDKLTKLKHLEISKNNIKSVKGSWFETLRSLRYLNLKKNQLTNENIPGNLFTNSSLQTVDLSFNKLTEVPTGLLSSTSLITLDLSNNQISNVPKELFMNCISLIVLNLSHNNIDSFPTNLRRMPNLKTLILSHNKLSLAQLRAVAGLKKLESLQLRNTSRRMENFPPDLDKLQFLTELDISQNNLIKLPDTIFGIKSLKRFNFSENEIEDISSPEEGVTCWPLLEMLNVSHNKLSVLPPFVTRLSRMRQLFLDGNKLTFQGIPVGIGKLEKLQLFSASDNLLENIPEGLSRCGELRHLNLRGNRLVTLPDAIHVMMETLTEFMVDRNPNLKMPPKLDDSLTNNDKAVGSDSADKDPYLYNIDFGLENQMRLARGGKPAPVQDPSSSSTSGVSHKESTASRIRRLRKKRAHLEESLDEESQGQSNVVLEGMRRIAAEKNSRERPTNSDEKLITDEDDNQGGKKWQKTLEKPNWNYSQLFEDGAGEGLGIEQWDIDHFRPRKLFDLTQLGQFYRGDCYLVLETWRDDTKSTLNHTVHYWIGNHATLDKVTCAAMHAVNLRNYLETETRSHRQQDQEEDSNFIDMWSRNFITFNVMDGCKGESGFMSGDEEPYHKKRLYRVYLDGDRTRLYSCPITPASLSSSHVYIFDDILSTMYVWLGDKVTLVNKRKGRLIAGNLIDKQKKHKNGRHCNLVVLKQGKETDDFKSALIFATYSENEIRFFDNYDYNEIRAVLLKEPALIAVERWPEMLPIDMDWIPSDWMPEEPIAIQIVICPGTLEMKQIHLPLKANATTERRQLQQSLVENKTEEVYIIQSSGLVFVWTAEKAINFLKNAAYKLAIELLDAGILISSSRRPHLVLQNTENHLFKMQFADWKDEKVVVDYTRSMASIRQNGDNLSELNSNAMKVDLRSFFMPREKVTSWDEAETMMDECNEELVVSSDDGSDHELVGKTKYLKYLKQFVFHKNRWLPVDEHWRGHFFSRDCFIVNVDYWEFMDEELEDEEDPEEELPQRVQTVVYFWQGREASNIPWLTFNMTLLREMQVVNGESGTGSRNVEAKMMHQQQELPQFLAHFTHEFIVHSGSYADMMKRLQTKVQMYYMRDNGNPLYTRTIEVLPVINFLNSHYHYIVKVPAKLAGTQRDQVMCWIGKSSNEKYNDVLARVADSIFLTLVPQNSSDKMPEIHMIKEGEEPELFWKFLLGKNRNYDREAPFKDHSRLFRLSNDSGYFSASEKCADFCQDDLADDDSMLLDTGVEIYIWHGNKSSEVERKLSLRAGKLYHEHMARLQPNVHRKLCLTMKNKESHGFRRCFHGWGPYKEPKEWSG